MQHDELTNNFCLHPEVNYTVIDDEAILMGPADDTLYELNAVGTFILKQLEEKPQSIRSISDLICENYDVAKEQAISDTKAFINGLTNNNWLVKY